MSNDAIRERILDVASRLFLHYGYKRTTVNEIASEAGVAKGSIYMHFPSKESIFGACSGRICREALDIMSRAARRDLPAPERLKAMLLEGLLHIWDFCHQAPHSPTLWIEVMDAASRYALEAREESRKIIAGIIADGQRDGAFCADLAPGPIAGLVQLSVGGFEPPYMVVENRRMIETELPRLVELICRGLRAPANEGELRS